MASSKDKGGRPLKFKSVKKLKEAIDAYFDAMCGGVYLQNANSEPVLDPDGDKIRIFDDQRITISGLAVALGCSRRTLLNYEYDSKFFPTIKKAKDIIEASVEGRSLGSSPAGAIFNLCNNFQEWENTQNVNVSDRRPMDRDEALDFLGSMDSK